MENIFQVRVTEFSNLLEIDGARTCSDFATLLEALEYDDISGMGEEELRDFCIMSLQDLDPVEAAYVVLRHDMGDVLRDGQARNLASEMLEEKLWEEYANSTLHERMFNAGSLLYAAFPLSFPKPDAVHLQLEVTAQNRGAKELLTEAIDESCLARLLSDGMESNAVLHRLYGKELTGKSFPNADEIVWTVRTDAIAEDVVRIDVIGSGYWLDALEDTDLYTSNAYSDDIKSPPVTRVS